MALRVGSEGVLWVGVWEVEGVWYFLRSDRGFSFMGGKLRLYLFLCNEV